MLWFMTMGTTQGARERLNDRRSVRFDARLAVQGFGQSPRRPAFGLPCTVFTSATCYGSDTMRSQQHTTRIRRVSTLFSDIEFYKRDACHPRESPGLSVHPLGAMQYATELPTARARPTGSWPKFRGSMLGCRGGALGLGLRG